MHANRIYQENSFFNVNIGGNKSNDREQDNDMAELCDLIKFCESKERIRQLISKYREIKEQYMS